MKLEKIVVGSLDTNCYILKSDNSAIVVDPGAEPHKIIKVIEGCKTDLILLTHRHSDHVGALQKVKEVSGAKSAIHRLDWIDGFDVELQDGQIISFNSETIKVLHTPGHTSGSCCFLIKNILISGDTLFPNGPGNTFGSSGDEKTIYASIRQKLMPLPDDTQVFPGHGASTTIGKERTLY
jgi:hydroxyacylglutathione hydrolase